VKNDNPVMQMKTLRILKPGQPGTKKLLHKYGESLVCVRYRLDPKAKRRMTTVELIIAEGAQPAKQTRIPMNKKVRLRVAYGEIDVGRKVKAAGGKWNRQLKVWELAYKQTLQLGLTERIMNG